MELTNWLKYLIEKEGSDLYLSTGSPPAIKVHGRLLQIENTQILQKGDVEKIAQSIMSARQTEEFYATSEMNFALSESGIGRFRVNVFQQRSETAMVMRRIPSEIPTPESLGLPEVLKTLVMQKRGLILFVGATGSGKSTSLASLINYRNERSAGHIITIEDPIEFTHRHKVSIVNQREVGIDTHSYENALKNTLRQAPDVILIGEIRSQDTMDHAVAFAETGHLCLSTLHANSANQAINRIINFFPKERHEQLLLDLSLNLRGIISQRLIPTLDGRRTVAVEILINSPLIAEMIKRGEINNMKDVMMKSENLGMMTFDSSLFKLYDEQKISLEEALHNADSQNNLRIKIALKEGLNPADFETELSLEQEKELPEMFRRQMASKAAEKSTAAAPKTELSLKPTQDPMIPPHDKPPEK